MIRRLTVLVLAAFLAGTLALAVPASASRTSVDSPYRNPRVKCETVKVNQSPQIQRLSKHMARKFSRQGWRLVIRLDSQRAAIRALTQENRELRAQLEAERAEDTP